MFADQFTCGNLFRQIRERRHLKIADVQGPLHKTSVSFFETKDANIRLFSLMEILKPTMTEPQEFFELIDQTHSQLRRFFRELSTLYESLDLEGLQMLLTDYHEIKRSETPQYMLKLIVMSCIAKIKEQSPVFSAEDEECIQQFLLTEGRWFHFEYLVYANLCHSLSNRINDRLLRHMVTKYQEFHLSRYDEAFVGAFYNLSARYLKDADYDRALSMLDIVADFPVKNTALYLRHHVAFIRLAVPILKYQDQDAKKKLAALLMATEIIDPKLYKTNMAWMKSLNLDPEAILNNIT